MATNEILRFCETDTGTNLLTQGAYNADTQRTIGHQPGVARSELENKALRQVSLIAAGVAQFMANRQANNIVDTLTVANIAAYLETAIGVILAGPVLTITTSPVVLTAANAGLVLCDATASSLAITLPACNASGTPLEFQFVRIDGSANTVTITRAGADTIDGVNTGFTLSISDYRVIKGNGAALWSTTSQSSVHAGEVFWWGANSAPPGSLKANGASLSTTTYAALFAKLGYTFGGSGGSFNIPDLRGEFIRGWDDSRGIDPSRTFGSAQGDQNQAVTGSMLGVWASGVVGATGAFAASNTGTANLAGGGSTLYETTFAFNSGGGSEARPRNVALLACIRY